jgi:mannose-6-phosphate isomerase-like protein (cupin superfamily)
MIKKVYSSSRDLYNLSTKRVDFSAPKDTFDYRGLVVNKPWGYEYLLFENESVAIWILHLKAGESTSLHCHPQKKTSLIVLSGEVQVSTLSDSFSFKQKEGLIIDKGVFHSSKALSPDGLFLMEIETPPNKTDLVRLKDEYGRQGKGYENVQQMSRDLSAYEYCDFHKLAKTGACCERRGLLGICIKIVRGSITDICTRHLADSNLISVCLLEGNIIDNQGGIIMGAGEAAEADYLLSKLADIPKDGEYTLMIIR